MTFNAADQLINKNRNHRATKSFWVTIKNTNTLSNSIKAAIWAILFLLFIDY